MKFFEGKSKREQTLVLFLIVSLAFAAYLMFRVKPAFNEFSKLEENIKDEERKYKKLLRETNNVKPSSSVKKEIASIKKKIDKEEKNLNALDIAFVDLGNQEELRALLSDITLSAENNQLTILSKANKLSDLVAIVGKAEIERLDTKNQNLSRKKKKKSNQNITKALSNNSSLKRHIFEIELRGNFTSTYKFIKSLQKMKHGVLIAKVNLAADSKNTYNGRRLITTTLTLAI